MKTPTKTSTSSPLDNSASAFISRAGPYGAIQVYLTYKTNVTTLPTKEANNH